MKKIIYNGKIYIEEGHFEEAVYIEDGFIKRTGSSEELLKEAEGCQLIDAGGRTILPGLNDSHLHLGSIGEWFLLPRLGLAKSIEDLVDIGRDYMAKNPELSKEGFIGNGWNQDLFTGDRAMPTRWDLDKISREVPIVFYRVCGHVASANSKALELAGVLDKLPEIEGGLIEVDHRGEVTGILHEGGATGYVARVIPDFSEEDWEKIYLSAQDYALSVGLTSVQSTDARDEGFKGVIALLNKLEEEKKLKIRYRHQLSLMDVDKLKDYLAMKKTSLDRKLLDYGPLKLFKDGSLGGRTALMRRAYKDDPDNQGVEVLTSRRMDELVALADKSGMQVITHAIGDRAIEETLDSYERVIEDGKNINRHGLVHCQITDRKLLERIAALGVINLVQPIFLDYDLHVVEARVGRELASTSYAFRSMDELGIPTSYGTDAPIEDCNPFPSIYCAVTRKDLKGYPEGGHFPEERVSLSRAIDNYSLASAYSEFKEDIKGRIKPGYLADMIVLDRDIFTIDEDEIKDVKVELTLVGGEVVYKR